MALPKDIIERLQTASGSYLELGAVSISYRLAWCVAEMILQDEGPSDRLKEEFAKNRRGTLQRIQPCVENLCQDGIDDLLAVSESCLSGQCPPSRESFYDERYLARTVHAVMERLFVNSAGPPVFISPVPHERITSALSGGSRIAVLFDWPLGFINEFYPLWTDAFVYSQTHRNLPQLKAFGVHSSWLTEGCRCDWALIYDDELDIFLEGPLEKPVSIEAAIHVCQPRDVHQAISNLLTANAIPHINPYGKVAATADDKWRCYEDWAKCGVSTPPMALLGKKADEDEVHKTIHHFLRKHGASKSGWIVQPRYGTEGNLVTYIPSDEFSITVDNILETWKKISVIDDAVLRPRVGMVHIWDTSEESETDTPRPFDIRINVSYDGESWQAESGYLMIAADPQKPVSSIAQGGAIQPLTLLETCSLFDCPVTGKTKEIPGWTEACMQKVCQVAIEAIKALKPLDLAGVDVKLDWNNGHLEPSVLDANPRPAGLLQADLIGPDTAEAGIAIGLWRRIAGLIHNQ